MLPIPALSYASEWTYWLFKTIYCWFWIKTVQFLPFLASAILQWMEAVFFFSPSVAKQWHDLFLLCSFFCVHMFLEIYQTPNQYVCQHLVVSSELFFLPKQVMCLSFGAGFPRSYWRYYKYFANGSYPFFRRWWWAGIVYIWTSIDENTTWLLSADAMFAHVLYVMLLDFLVGELKVHFLLISLHWACHLCLRKSSCYNVRGNLEGQDTGTQGWL